jgi:hypothetical protein
MVCGKIQTPATLSYYVHMHLMKSKFLASLYLRNLVCFYAKRLVHYILKETYKQLSVQIPEASFTLPSIAITGTSTYEDGHSGLIFFLCNPRCKKLSNLLIHISRS